MDMVRVFAGINKEYWITGFHAYYFITSYVQLQMAMENKICIIWKIFVRLKKMNSQFEELLGRINLWPHSKQKHLINLTS